MTRWSTMLSVYKIKIKHIAGNKNTTADALSQKFIEDKDEDEPKQAIPDKFINKSTFPVEELSQNSFGHISTKSSTIPTVLMPA